MGKPVIGEVVVLPFPHTDLQIGKRRPALVVANLSGDDLVLCQITSQSHDFEHGSLNVDSFIRSSRLFTIERSVILYSAARVRQAKLDEVRDRIRDLFT